MSEPSSISTGIAARYATALFDLALETGAVDALDADADALAAAISESAELRDLMRSPVYGRDEAEAGIGAVADAMGL
ncbi:MAG: F0F1 ATP synthase subunit delta, partial [Pseudomonadota bacterium]